jgi:hypothetical protein
MFAFQAARASRGHEWQGVDCLRRKKREAEKLCNRDGVNGEKEGEERKRERERKRKRKRKRAQGEGKRVKIKLELKV